ncbi:MAG TPA: hypothetical protein VFV87_14470 [Pirellulaceae bacterium]|nr:hypothetical protein [Pirellulaceae bacterium]
MGSFNHNFHIQSGDSDRVVKAIRDVLAKEGWRASDKPPVEESQRFGQSASGRALWVSKPAAGWTSILDSDLAGSMSLAPALAAELDAYALLCLVNDSDSWRYTLAHGKELLDEFDSAAASGPSEYSAAKLGQIAANLGLWQQQMADGTLQRRVAELQERFIESAPPAIKEIRDQIAGGQVAPESLAQYHAWMLSQAPRMTALVQEVMGDLLGAPPVPESVEAGKSKRRTRKKAKAQRAALREHIERLRPLLAAAVTDDQLEAVLDEKATFAEETLARFLPLVGLQTFYAYLDYDHKDEASQDELAAHGIEFAHHLMFELPGP